MTELEEELVLDDTEAFYIMFINERLDISTIIPIVEHMGDNPEFVKFMRLHSVEKSLE